MIKPPFPTLIKSGHYQVKGLEANYLFNRGVGTILYDSAPGKNWDARNHGAITGATWGGGKDGPALVFNGAPDKVVIPDNPAFSIDTAGQLTVEVTFRIDNLVDDNDLIIKLNTAGNTAEWLIRVVSADGKLHSSILQANGAVYLEAVASRFGIVAGVVYKVTSRMNTVGSPIIDQFIDGVPDGSDNTPVGTMGPNSTGDVYVGTNPQDATRTVKGLISRVVIWNHAFPNEEIFKRHMHDKAMFQRFINPGIFGIPVIPPGNVGALFNAGLMKGKLRERLFQC